MGEAGNVAAVDHELEAAVLSSVFLSERMLPRVLDAGLRPEHFHFAAHGRVFAGMLALFDRGERVDVVTVQAECETEDRDWLTGLSLAAPGAASAVTYARQLIDLWRRRRMAEAGRLLIAAGNSGRLELRQEAESLLAEHHGEALRSYTPQQLGERLWDRLERGVRPAWSLPSQKLTNLIGGLRPGEVTLVGGWTSHGKSVFLDDVLTHVAPSAATHLFINEMTADERTDRMVSRATGVPALRVGDKEALSKRELDKVVDAIPKLPFGVTEAAGWSAQDIRREIRRRKYEVVGVDILHLIEYREERDLAEISRTLNVAAKESGCHILATVHLKDERLKSAVPPPPTLSDIKGAGALKQDADNVLFVYRECDDIGAPQRDARVWWAKARQGQTGGVRMTFDGDKMSFTENFFPGGDGFGSPF